tara:strand:- start:823 stop:1047 length:225 start_codon:yes stop_codon:yes gene_type:complete
LEVNVIHSIIGKVPKGGLCQKGPFLDELAEFNRVATDSPKQPLETGEIIIARVSQSDLDLIIGVGPQGAPLSIQ